MFGQKVEKLLGPDAPADSVFIDLVRRMIGAKVKFLKGLANTEIDQLSQLIGIPIPPDLREFWTVAVPKASGWWSWIDSKLTREDFDKTIVEELKFHVESGDVWLESWGERPESLVEAMKIVHAFVETGPALLPLFAHRWAVCEPCLPNTPVLSIYNSDWIYYGWNLESYLEHEFLGRDIYGEQPLQDHQSIGQWEEVLDCDRPKLPKPRWIETRPDESIESYNIHRIDNRGSLFHSWNIRCFGCLSTCSFREIENWNDSTGKCPSCGAESLIGDDLALPLDDEFVAKIKASL